MAAKKLGVDPTTWSAWEQSGIIMSKAYRHLVARFIGLPEGALYAMMAKRWSDSQGKPSPE